MCDITFSCPKEELSCVIGNLFTELEPPCDLNIGEINGLAICGTTHSGRHGCLIIYEDYCTFSGEEKDLEAVRRGVCVERRCKNG